uniref:Methyltransferase n=1 Tax=viral metagenome TaxID=1070528 RepID=A0A6C0CI40_9ZZZZ
MSSEETNLNLLEECLKTKTVRNVADKLNVCVGTVKRWIELKDVPIQYTFDLQKILSRDIDYSKYTSSLKDQFFTPKELAEECWETFNREVEINIEEYTFIEPSAGDGSFLDILPNGSIGLDIEPRSNVVQKQDYLTWTPEDTTKKYIVFGNPPFGLRGHLALNFINHSHSFADYVCFILPQLFESDGKGSPRKRVKGYNLVYSEGLSAMFYNPEKQEVKVNGVFQIWSKYSSNSKYTIKENSEENMKVYSLSDGGTVSSTRNKKMIGKCDIYLPSTCFGKENMRIYKSFEDLPGKKGYGVVFFNDKEKMIEHAEEIDWSSVSFLSTNSAYNLRTSIIFEQFI